MTKRKRNNHLRVRIADGHKKDIENIQAPPGTKRYRKAKAICDRERRVAYKLLPIIRGEFGKKRKRCILGLTSLCHREARHIAHRIVSSFEKYT